MRNFLVAGNWKMHGDAASNRELVAGILEGAAAAENVSLLVCPPFPYLASVASQLEGSSVELGAQNVSEHETGAYTGEVSPAMLRDVGCRYAIVGHSERRTLYGETSAQVAEKMAAALGAGLMPILCIGETLSERESGSTEQVVGEQLAAAVERNGIAAFGSSVVAYEPVWAIGTGKTATPEQAQDVHRYIRSVLAGHDASVAENVQILYGGSVKGDNAAGLFGMPDIDGGLIGGASLKPADFLAIARAATEI
ncbi:MAG: triose-phosphate isomerase [Gammaproteobacteria bacterium]|jgi:triosephosphate isomerase|nr:triose-phosphate isomerase [Gammaproteobacteria bacterium]MDH3865287.1 triose-phosphate isomerase [Gammaproteobacteria bacterium]NCF60943.1 triose-phosphate isomerase [Gammaproteobacteria bacterium]